MSKELEALRSLGESLGDLEIDKDTMIPKFVLSGDKAKNYKIVEQALLELKTIKEAKPSKALECLEEIIHEFNEPQYELSGVYSYKNELLRRCENEVNTIKQALSTKSKKEKVFEEIQSIMDTWHTSNIMDNESALR